MTMTNQERHPVLKDQAREVYGTVRLGFYEGFYGQPFSRHYETALPHWQQNYELGRLIGVSLRAAKIAPQPWPAKVMKPKALWQQFDRAVFHNGISSLPPARDAEPPVAA